MPNTPNMARELALLLALSTLWGASYTFIRIGVETIPPVTLIALRTLIAGAVLLAVIRWRGLKLPRGGAIWSRFLFQACLNSAIPFTLIAWAEQSTDAGLAAILNSTTPIFAFLMTVLITRHEPVTVRKLFGVVAGLAGICLVIGVQALSGLGRGWYLSSQSCWQRCVMPAPRSSAGISRGSTRSCRPRARSSAAPRC